MTASRPTYMLLATSEAWKARLAPTRLKATLAETVLRGADFALAASEGCDPDKGTIEAELWRDGGWTRGRCDRPDVVVVWGGGPLMRRHQAAHAWAASRFPVIRAVGPNKAALASFLGAGPVGRYLPPQEILPPTGVEAALLSGLKNWGALVVKPANGSSGKGVQFIEPHGAAWRLRAGDSVSEGSAAEVTAQVAASMSGRIGYRQFLMQRYVRSVAPDGRALQFRIDLHKDGRGDWRQIQTSAHFGRPGLMVSNIARGGCLGTLRGATELRTVRLPSEIFDEALALAHGAADAIDARPDASIHEVGVDIAIDEADRLWLLEVNLYPETLMHEIQRAELAVDFGLAVAAGRLPASRAAVDPVLAAL